MASRSRRYNVRYGGWLAGQSNFGPRTEPAYMGVHQCVDETHPGPPYRSGGPLSVKKEKVHIKRFSPFEVMYHPVLGYYKGYMCVNPYIPVAKPVASNLSGWGAKGINRTMPLHPIYQLGVSIGELKDLPGLISQTKRGLAALAAKAAASGRPYSGPRTIGGLLKGAGGAAKNSGDAFLYGAFGILPMIQDLLFLTQMQEKLNKKISWLRRHNGKSVRRKIELDSGGYSENIARSIAPTSTLFPSLSSYLYLPGQTTAVSIPVTKTYQGRIWFAAKYRYYIPELAVDPRTKPPPWWLVGDLLGLSPDPVILYKLIPWSWLLDWFTSVGNVIGNIYLRARYHVVTEYAYVMASETVTYTAPGYCKVYTGQVGASPGTKSMNGASQTIYEFRQREVANPYGFGITYASLSAYQWSILVALGLSRGGKNFAPRP